MLAEEEVLAGVIQHVGVDDLEGAALSLLEEIGEAVVQLVVAHGGGVVTRLVHRLVVGIPLVEGEDGRSLEDVAGVQHQRAGGLSLDLLDQVGSAGDPAQALAVAGVVGEQMVVRIVGMQDGQVNGGCKGPRGADQPDGGSQKGAF
ncbi:hypothetical protein D3C72_1992390 [compost metagenome]